MRVVLGVTVSAQDDQVGRQFMPKALIGAVMDVERNPLENPAKLTAIACPFESRRPGLLPFLGSKIERVRHGPKLHLACSPGLLSRLFACIPLLLPGSRPPAVAGIAIEFPAVPVWIAHPRPHLQILRPALGKKFVATAPARHIGPAWRNMLQYALNAQAETVRNRLTGQFLGIPIEVREQFDARFFVQPPG